LNAASESLLSKIDDRRKDRLIGENRRFFIRGIPRLGCLRLKMADGPMAFRNFGPATAMAAGIGLAATWNTTLAERVGLNS